MNGYDPAPIRRSRRAKGWTQARLAELSQFTRRTIISLEQGRAHFLTVHRVCDVLDLDPEPLFDAPCQREDS